MAEAEGSTEQKTSTGTGQDGGDDISAPVVRRRRLSALADLHASLADLASLPAAIHAHTRRRYSLSAADQSAHELRQLWSLGRALEGRNVAPSPEPEPYLPLTGRHPQRQPVEWPTLTDAIHEAVDETTGCAGGRRGSQASAMVGEGGGGMGGADTQSSASLAVPVNRRGSTSHQAVARRTSVQLSASVTATISRFAQLTDEQKAAMEAEAKDQAKGARAVKQQGMRQQSRRQLLGLAQHGDTDTGKADTKYSSASYKNFVQAPVLDRDVVPTRPSGGGGQPRRVSVASLSHGGPGPSRRFLRAQSRCQVEGKTTGSRRQLTAVTTGSSGASLHGRGEGGKRSEAQAVPSKEAAATGGGQSLLSSFTVGDLFEAAKHQQTAALERQLETIARERGVTLRYKADAVGRVTDLHSRLATTQEVCI